jgi:hypothetical protein
MKLIQTGQTGGQQYSDTSPFSIPWPLAHPRAVLRTRFSRQDSLM